MLLNLCSSTHDASLTNKSHILAISVPSEFVERFSKSASNFFVTSLRVVVQLTDQLQSELIVPRDTHAIETPKYQALASIRLSFIHSPASQ
jgi:hypothetical protein